MRVFLIVAALLIALVLFAALIIVLEAHKRAVARKSETALLGVVAPRPGGVVHRDHPDMTPADRELLRKLLDEGDDHVA